MALRKRAWCAWVGGAFIAAPGSAQVLDPFPCQRVARVVPEAHVREADALWARRIWRVIDLREKINHPLFFPMDPDHGCPGLFEVLRTGLLVDGSLTAYDPGPLLNDDAFTRPMAPAAVAALFERVDTMHTEDLATGVQVAVPVAVRLEAREVTRYMIKEDWVFDKQRSMMVVRIIGLAPMREVRGDDGELRGHAPLFWLHYPECRHVFGQWYAPGRWNEASRPSFEEIFRKRMFSSTIVKVGNVYDRWIIDHRSGIDALLEAERIKQELLEFQFDLWHH